MRKARKIHYVAEPRHVREVTLIGTADFKFWSDYLKAEGLTPTQRGEGAQVLIVSAEMAWMGVRFTEVSFSVRTAPGQDGNGAGLRLIQAFTSSRVFAWCERTLFATPYSHALCRVSVQDPPMVRLDAPGDGMFSAGMASPARAAMRTGDEIWEGPVFLPSRGAAGDARLFFGRLSGHTTAYPFSTADRFAIVPSARGGVLQMLADSRFLPQEWVVRADATHGKSRTYRRADIPADEQVS